MASGVDLAASARSSSAPHISLLMPPRQHTLPRTMVSRALVIAALALWVLEDSATVAVVRDGHYYQDLCFRLTGGSIAWPSPDIQKNYTDRGMFIPQNIIATRFQGWREQVFVVTPRFREGVPFTLGRFDIFQRCFPCLQPFPSWSPLQDCPQELQNAVDLFVDSRDLLWVLDSGVVHTLSAPEWRTYPKVVAYEPLTGKVVHTLDLASLVCSGSRLQYLLVHYQPLTNTPWVYVSDAATRTIIVYDVAKGKGHRVVLPEVVEPSGPRDVLYMTMIKRLDQNNRIYFTYLSSNTMFSIKVEDLQSPEHHGTVMEEGRKPSPLVLLGSADSNIFFRYKRKPSIFMWNVDSTFKESNFIPIQEGEEGRLTTQVMPWYGGMMWMLESNFQDYVSNTTGSLGASMLLHPFSKD